MKTLVVAGLAAVALGCGSAPDESTRNTSASQQGSGAATEAVQCADAGRYVAVGTTVLDSTTGKLWQRDVVPWRRTQAEGVAYCATLELEGKTGWRLPNVDELGGIRFKPGLIFGGPQFCMPSIDQNAFPDTPPAEFLTSTVRPRGEVVYVDFADGRSHDTDPSDPLYTRCVHDADTSTLGERSTLSLPAR